MQIITLEGYIAQVTMMETLNSLNKEEKDKLYLPQSAFSSCLNRAKAFNEELKQRIDNIVAYAIIWHRENVHGEIHTEEKTLLVAAMPVEDVETVNFNAKSWWKS